MFDIKGDPLLNILILFTVCARRPYVVLLCGAIVASILASGISIIDITTDPVELWASPTSRSRIEKEYYDSHFEPFYRTEQIIIHATGLPDVVHNATSGHTITFGPVFNRDFLLEVKRIQDKIRNLSLIVSFIVISRNGFSLHTLCS